MKLLVFSDSHGQLEPMRMAIEQEKPQGIIHLGDHWRDSDRLAEEYPMLPLYRVAGNCDLYRMESGCTELLLCKIEGVLLYLTHGHRQNVKSTLLSLRLAAQEAGARAALFGHTHSALCQEVGGVLLLNPGAAQAFRGSYGVLEIKDGQIHGTIQYF